MAVTFKDVLFLLSPPVWRERDKNGLYETIIDSVSQEGGQDAFERIRNLNSYLLGQECPADFLNWLASFIDFPLERFAILFGWSIQKQRDILDFVFPSVEYLGTKKAVTDFVENFIDNSMVQEVYEPWKNILRLSRSDISGRDHMRGDYYRDCVLRIGVSNARDEVNELLRWVIDPRVHFYVTLMHVSDFSPVWGENEASGILSENNQFYKHQTTFIISKSDLSGEDVLAGKADKWLSQILDQVSSSDDFWWPRSDSIWTTEELSTVTVEVHNPFDLSDDEISGTTTLGGRYKNIYNSPITGSKWDYIGPSNIS